MVSIKVIALLVVVLKLSMVSSELVASERHWLLSCKACTDILNECSTTGFCFKEQCFQCVNDTENSRCNVCSSDIKAAGSNMNCDPGYSWHNTVCNFSCRAREGITVFRNGVCNVATGRCDCS